MRAATDYVEIMLEESLYMEREMTIESIEHIEWEANYIKTCIETNSIVNEASHVENKNSILGRIAEIINNIFSKFLEKVKKIKMDLKPFKEEYLDKLEHLDYEGINLNVFPHWNVNVNTIKKHIKDMENAARTVIRNEPPEDTSIDYIIKNITPFNKFHDEKLDYKTVMRKKFSTGDNLSDNKPQELSNANEIKKVCLIAKEFITNYDSYANELNNARNDVTKIIDDMDKYIKSKDSSVKESLGIYLELEGAYLRNTDLKFCSDFGLVFEDATSGNSSNNEKEEPKSNSVEVNSDNQNGNESGNNTNIGSVKTATYYKNICTIIQTALITAITVLEEKLYVYKTIIKQVVLTKTNKKIMKKENKLDRKDDKKDTKEAVKDAVKTRKDEKKQDTKQKKIRNTLEQIKGKFSRNK